MTSSKGFWNRRSALYEMQEVDITTSLQTVPELLVTIRLSDTEEMAAKSKHLIINMTLEEAKALAKQLHGLVEMKEKQVTW